MKKIFYIFASAIVALGAVACQNDIEEGVKPEQQGESVSICVTIDEPTRVALGDFEEGKGYKLSFEEGDQLCVTDAWGGYGDERDFWFTYTKTDGDSFVFTCKTEGVSAIVGQPMSVFYLGCGVAGQGVLCDSSAGLDGIVMDGSTDALGQSAISLSAAPVLKLTSDYLVTLTTSKNAFALIKSWGIGQYNTYTTTSTGTTYIPLFAKGEMTLSATVKGEVVKSTTVTLEKNKIYNLGTIDAPEEVLADGDAAGIEIAIDGVFTDWANITKNVATVADGATYASMKTLKTYADKDNIYVYVEIEKVSDVLHMGVFLDLDNDQATGGTYTDCRWTGTGDALMKNQCIYNSALIQYKWGSNTIYENGAEVGTFTINGAMPVLENGVLYAEFAISRAELPTISTKNIGVAAYVLSNWGASGVLPATGTLVIPVHN